MKILLTGKHSKDIAELVKSLHPEDGRVGFEVVSEKPDAVISYGGDGTLLASERQFPGMPKLPIRDSKMCRKCPEHETEALLKRLIKGKLELKEHSKLETEVEGKSLVALNDFVIRNKDAMHSIRFKVTNTASHPVLDTGSIIIGDGIVISTPFGSSGYFKSITQQTFEEGFGLAFNNTTKKVDPQNFGDTDQITFKLVRGHAALTSDNSPDIYIIPEGMEVIFKQSLQIAKIYELESLRCPNCEVIRG